MRFGLLFALPAGCLLAQPLLAPGPFDAVFLVLGATLVLPAAAYLAAAPTLLGKRPDGSLDWWSYGLAAAFHAQIALGMALLRKSGARPFDRVADGVFLGRRLTAPEVSLLLNLTPQPRVLDLTAELTEVPPLRGDGYLCLPVLDGTAPTTDQLDAAVAWIHAGAAGPGVFVHCAAGHGRSATCVAAWLLAIGRAENVDDAEAHLRAARPGVRLVSAQRQVLQRWLDARRACPAATPARPRGPAPRTRTR